MNLNDALKYTTTEINAMLPKIAEGGAEAQAGHHHRLVAADAFSDAGREPEAALLRSEHPIYVHKGKVYRTQHPNSIGDPGFSHFLQGYFEAVLHPLTWGELQPRHQLPEHIRKEIREDASHLFQSGEYPNNLRAARNTGYDLGSKAASQGLYKLYYDDSGEIGSKRSPEYPVGQPEGLPE
jgi:hypothetical protein